MKRAVAGAEREQREGASGKWVAHWKMVHIVRPVWEKVGADNQLGRAFPPLTYTQADADGLMLLEPAPRTVRGARDLLSVALQYGNAFGQGFQAAALKPADFFGNDDVLYLMEDMATGEIRLSILWEWLHKGAQLTEDDPATGVQRRRHASRRRSSRGCSTRSTRSCCAAGNRDVHDDSKTTTLPDRARDRRRPTSPSRVKLPWYIDLLNLNLDNHDLADGQSRASRPTSTPSSGTARGSPRTSDFDRSDPSTRTRSAVMSIVRTGNRRDPGVVRQPPIRGDRSPVHRASGGRAARHDRPRLHGGARGGRGVLRPPARALRGAQEHHHLRPVLAGAGGGDEADGDRGDLPRRLGDLRQGRDERGSRDPISPAIRSARCPTRRRRSCAPCSRRIGTSSICARG